MNNATPIEQVSDEVLKNRAAKRKWYHEHREKILAQQKAWREAKKAKRHSRSTSDTPPPARRKRRQQRVAMELPQNVVACKLSECPECGARFFVVRPSA